MSDTSVEQGAKPLKRHAPDDNKEKDNKQNQRPRLSHHPSVLLPVNSQPQFFGFPPPVPWMLQPGMFPNEWSNIPHPLQHLQFPQQSQPMQLPLQLPNPSNPSNMVDTKTTSTTSTTNVDSIKTKMQVNNDYCQHFVDTGQRAQNFVRDSGEDERFQVYPRLQKLLELKTELNKKRASPPMYMNVDLKAFDLTQLGSKFDVIYVDPPWEEYSRRAAGKTLQPIPYWTYEEIENLNIEEITATPCFLFIWCGSGGIFDKDRPIHLDQGRKLMKKWGFRRAEDICWCKTNKNGQANIKNEYGVLCRTKEHCLMGIKGSVRRRTDTHIIHANIDTDVIIDEEPLDPGDTKKPEEIYHIIERFCLGRRRLELFGRDVNIRAGWVTLGNELTGSNYNSQTYLSYMEEKGELHDGTPCDGYLVGSTAEIEDLRPKSPTRSEK